LLINKNKTGLLKIETNQKYFISHQFTFSIVYTVQIRLKS
jgi:hypothetical protein